MNNISGPNPNTPLMTTFSVSMEIRVENSRQPRQEQEEIAVIRLLQMKEVDKTQNKKPKILPSKKWVWINSKAKNGLKWTQQESEKLVELVNNTPEKKGMWKQIAAQMENKTQQQCLSRWCHIKNIYVVEKDI